MIFKRDEMTSALTRDIIRNIFGFLEMERNKMNWKKHILLQSITQNRKTFPTVFK